MLAVPALTSLPARSPGGSNVDYKPIAARWENFETWFNKAEEVFAVLSNTGLAKTDLSKRDVIAKLKDGELSTLLDIHAMLHVAGKSNWISQLRAALASNSKQDPVERAEKLSNYLNNFWGPERFIKYMERARKAFPAGDAFPKLASYDAGYWQQQVEAYLKTGKKPAANKPAVNKPAAAAPPLSQSTLPPVPKADAAPAKNGVHPKASAPAARAPEKSVPPPVTVTRPTAPAPAPASAAVALGPKLDPGQCVLDSIRMLRKAELAPDADDAPIFVDRKEVLDRVAVVAMALENGNVANAARRTGTLGSVLTRDVVELEARLQAPGLNKTLTEARLKQLALPDRTGEEWPKELFFSFWSEHPVKFKN